MKKIMVIVLVLVVNLYSSATEVEKACDGGNIEECLNLGDMYYIGKDVPRDVIKGDKAYNKACDAKLADACNRLGEIYFRMKGSESSKVFFEKSCNLENPRGCFLFGRVSELTAKEDREYIKVKKAYEKSCNLGSSGGCYALGNMYEFGYAWDNPKGKDVYIAKKLYKKSCDAGNSLGCRYYNNLIIR